MRDAVDELGLGCARPNSNHSELASVGAGRHTRTAYTFGRCTSPERRGVTMMSTEGIIRGPSLFGLRTVVAVGCTCLIDDDDDTRRTPLGVCGRFTCALPFGVLSSPLILAKVDTIDLRAIRPPSIPHLARPPFCNTVFRVCASRRSPALLYTSTVAPSTSVRIIVCVDSESAVKIVNLGKEIGSGSVSISSTGEELEDPDPYDLRRGVTSIVPAILNVNTFLAGGSKSFMLM